MIDYFLSGSPDFLAGMGVNHAKLPPRDFWFQRAWSDFQVPENDPKRDRFLVAWLVDGETIGHSSINRIKWGEEANAHLHMWRSDLRRSGLGVELFSKSVSLYFERFELKRLYVEPMAGNPAPNRTLAKLGFEFLERYRGVPSPVAFEQDVNRYVMPRERWVI
jgi:RimJ/RimL family protein N-acetyltransferase